MNKKIFILCLLVFSNCGKAIHREEWGGVADGQKKKRVIVSDSFNRADNVTSLGSADTGQVWNLGGSAVYGIASSRARMFSGSGNVYVAIPETDLLAIQVEALIISTNFQLVFRQNDVSNSFWQLNSTPGNATLTKSINGVVTNWNISATVSNGSVLRVELRGCNIIAKLNSTIVFNITDCAIHNGNQYGFEDSSPGDDARFDNFLIEALED